MERTRDGAIRAYHQAMTDARYFEAHEILEDAWRPTKAADLQTAIWVAAAYLHWQRGNHSGAERLAQRVEARLGAARGVPSELAALVCEWVAALLDAAPYEPIRPPLLDALCRWLQGTDG